MSEKYFKNFPFINYNGNLSRNIILKSVFLQNVISSYSSFYPYQVKDGERPDMIASNYYGDSDYYWLVYLSNQIIDPYFEWPMTYEQFTSYMVNKYGSIQVAYNIIDHYEYVEKENLTDNEKLYNYNYILSPTTYNRLVTEYNVSPSSTSMKDFNPTLWTPITSYEVEDRKNEQNRVIKLISKVYLKQIEREISGIFK